MKMLGNWASTYQHGGEDGVSVGKKSARNKETKQWLQDYQDEQQQEESEDNDPQD